MCYKMCVSWKQNLWNTTILKRTIEKTQLAQNVYKITSEQLGRIVRILDENCERCIDKSGSNDMIEINVDLIDASTFRRVDAYIKECLGDKESAEDGPATKKAKRWARTRANVEDLRVVAQRRMVSWSRGGLCAAAL